MKKSVLHILLMLISIIISPYLSPVSAQEAGTSFCDVTGIWSATWGEMFLFQSGSSLTGNYTWDDGRLEGSLSGSTFSGKWLEAPSYSEPRDAGDVEFIFSDDCTSFSGKWRYGSEGAWREDWTGTKLPEEKEFERIEEIFEEKEEFDRIEELIDEGLKPLCDVEGDGDILGHIISHGGDVRVIRKGEDITDEFAFVETLDPFGDPLKWQPIYQGDTIITGEKGRVKIKYYDSTVRAGWDRKLEYFQWGKHGGLIKVHEFEVPQKEKDFRVYFNSLSEIDKMRYFMGLTLNSFTQYLGADTHFCPGEYIDKNFPKRSFKSWIRRGIMRSLRPAYLDPRSGKIWIKRAPLPGTHADGIIGSRGTDFIVKVESQIDSASIFVNDGEITFTSATTGEIWDVSEGEMLINDLGQVDIQKLSQQKWLDLVEQIGPDNTDDELAQQLEELGDYVAPPEESESKDRSIPEKDGALESEKFPLDKIIITILGVIILALVYVKIRKK
jgi:hypothetical protein